MRKILFITFLLAFLFQNVHAQQPVESFKANYYKDFIYNDTNDGTPEDSEPYEELTVTTSSWGLTGHQAPFPNNSLVPTEVKVKGNPQWLLLNGSDSSGKRFDFQAVPVEITGQDHFKGIISGKVGSTDYKGYGRKTISELETFKTQKSKNWFLTSGKNGMDLGTGMANITGEVTFGTVLIDETRIDDPEPDFLFTQIAAPSQTGKKDKIYFIKENGQRIGGIIEVDFNSSSIPNLGGDLRFIQFALNNGPKPLKMLTFKISDFGITKDNYQQVRGLKYIPSGESDPAFVAADRQSIFVYKKLDASIFGSTIACKNDPASVSFRAASENGEGKYRFTYEITDMNNNTTTETLTSTGTGSFVEEEISIPTNVPGTITYKLIKVEDLGVSTSVPHREKSGLSEKHTIEIKDCSADYFVTTWKTTQDNETITIPTFSSDSYRYTIKWNGIDTNNSSVEGAEYDVTDSKTLTLSKAGRYRVRIRGVFPRIYFNNSGDKDKILTVEQWGTIKWKSQENAYLGCKNLQISATDTPDLIQTTSLKNMFKNAYSLNSNISTWTVTTITDMEGMFDDARSFNQNLASWDMSAVTNVNNMFRNSNMSANKLGLTLAGWETKLTNLSSSQTLGANLRYCNGGTTLTIANLTMPTEQCATPEEVGEIYLETTNTDNNRKRLAGILPNRAFEWLEEDVKIEGLTDVPSEKGAFKLAEGNGKFDFNGIKLNINKQVYSKNNPLRGFTSLDGEGVYPLANMKFSYKKEGSEDGFSYSNVVNSLPEKNLSEEGIIVYSNGHFYESIKVNSENKPSATGTLKWVRIDN